MGILLYKLSHIKFPGSLRLYKYDSVSVSTCCSEIRSHLPSLNIGVVDDDQLGQVPAQVLGLGLAELVSIFQLRSVKQVLARLKEVVIGRAGRGLRNFC